MAQDPRIVWPTSNAPGAGEAGALVLDILAVPVNPGNVTITFPTRRRIVELWFFTTTGGGPDGVTVTNDGNILVGFESINASNNGRFEPVAIIKAERIVEIGDVIAVSLAGAQTADCYLLHEPA